MTPPAIYPILGILQPSFADPTSIAMPDVDDMQLKVAIDSIKAYTRAYKLVRREARRDAKLGRVAPVLLSFGVEKALKAVLRFHEGKTAKGHDLLALYERLSEETQVWVMMTAGLTHVPRTLADNAKAFQDWRYLEEIGEERILYFVEDEIMLDITASCLKVLTHVVLTRARATSGRQVRSLGEAYRVLGIE